MFGTWELIAILGWGAFCFFVGALVERYNANSGWEN